MGKLGYSEIFIKFVKKLFKTRYQLSLIKASFLPSSPYLKESDKGVPCLFSFVLNGELINLSIKNNEKIVGYPIPNQKENTFSLFSQKESNYHNMLMMQILSY